jgi:hypothetical protein
VSEIILFFELIVLIFIINFNIYKFWDKMIIQFNLKYNYFINNHIILLTIIILKNIIFHYNIFKSTKNSYYTEHI